MYTTSAMQLNTTVAAAAAAAVPQPTQSAAPRTGPARRRLGWLGPRCCRYCGILLITVVGLVLYMAARRLSKKMYKQSKIYEKMWG